MSRTSKSAAKRNASVEDNLDDAIGADANTQPTAVAEAPDAAPAAARVAPVADATAQPSDVPHSVGHDIFRPLDAGAGDGAARDLEMIMDIPVRLSVELGRTRLTIKQLLELAQGSVVELDGLPGEPMDILINGYLIARGEVVVVEDKFGIRVTEIVTPSERLHRLNG